LHNFLIYSRNAVKSIKRSKERGEKDVPNLCYFFPKAGYVTVLNEG
jgi:hypothetical protein